MAEVLRSAFPGVEIELVPFDHRGLDQALKQQQLEFVLTNPGHYIELELAHGISRIVTRDTGVPVASTMLVRADRTDLQRLSDLRGKRVAIVGTSAFGGFQVMWRELASAGLDPIKEVSLTDVGFPMTRVVEAVITGRADAGIVRGCLIEQSVAHQSLSVDALRVLAPMTTDSLGCRVSSRLYPDWPLAKAKHTPPALAKRVVTALLGASPDSGDAAAGWTVPVDYQSVHDLFRELMIGPYEHLRHPSFAELVKRQWHWLAMLGLVFLAWLVHVARVEVLVRRRTVELAQANDGLRREMVARRQAEERDALHQRELDHAARLSLVGEMASGLAHEINQPLGAIINYAEGCAIRLRTGSTDPGALLQATDRIGQQARRASQVVQRMRAFVKKREPVRAELSLNEVVAETLELFEGPARRAGVRIDPPGPVELPMVEADRIQLQQVLLNLLQNALDASKLKDEGERYVGLSARVTQGGVEIAVTDRGIGLSKEARLHLFEPFFTTRTDGLGLGLSLCRSIVEDHGGRLVAEDNPSGGTIMRLWLPAVNTKAPT